MISIVVPVYNEEATIAKVLERLSGLEIEKEIIVVNDGSIDGTKYELEDIRRNFPNIRCINIVKNIGKGYALREGIRNAKGEIIAIQDADLEYNPEELIDLIDILVRKNAEVVYGIRFFRNSESPLWHKLINKSLSFLTSILYFKKIHDMETCYKIAYKNIWEKLELKSQRFEVEAEITAKILRNKFKIIQSPISYRFRPYKEGKKISWRDGLKTLWVLFKYRYLY